MHLPLDPLSPNTVIRGVLPNTDLQTAAPIVWLGSSKLTPKKVSKALGLNLVHVPPQPRQYKLVKNKHSFPKEVNEFLPLRDL